MNRTDRSNYTDDSIRHKEAQLQNHRRFKEMQERAKLPAAPRNLVEKCIELDTKD